MGVVAVATEEDLAQIGFVEPLDLLEGEVETKAFRQQRVGQHRAGVPGIPASGQALLDSEVLGILLDPAVGGGDC